jgi:hypothetical protein
VFALILLLQKVKPGIPRMTRNNQIANKKEASTTASSEFVLSHIAITTTADA